MGQCMWGWNDHYFTTWKEGNNTVKVITFQPIPGKKSMFVPAGGVAWFNAGVIDRPNQILCSVISDDERYRGGNGGALNYAGLLETQPQHSMLGMPATQYQYGGFDTLARKRGVGWAGNWFVAQSVIQYSMEIILGTRNSQAAYNPNLDANGLYQGGLGAGVTGMTDWGGYNGYYPLIPTSVGIEMGDGLGVVEYSVTKGDGTSAYLAPVPVFFGLVNPFGHLWRVVAGKVFDIGAEKSLAYVAPSLYAGHSWTDVSSMLLAAEMPRTEGYIKAFSNNLLVNVPTAVGATAATWFCDYFWTNVATHSGFRLSLVGGRAGTLARLRARSARMRLTRRRMRLRLFLRPYTLRVNDLA